MKADDERIQTQSTTPDLPKGQGGSSQALEGPSVPALAGPSSSGASELTQAPAAMQQLATMLMTSKQDVPVTGPVLQEWMATFAVAVQQARREGEQNPQARALLASLMSLASVESPAMLPDQKEGQTAKGAASKELAEETGQAPARAEEKPSKDPMPGMAAGDPGEDGEAPGRRPEKRQLPAPSGEEERPRKLARTATFPSPERLERAGSWERVLSSGAVIIDRPEQVPWYGRPNLTQHNSNPETRRLAMGGHTQPGRGRGRSSTHQFRVYSNAFEEPLPMPRWAANKAARIKPREETSGNLGVDAHRRPQLIITGSSHGSRMEGPAPAETGWGGPAPGGSWGDPWKPKGPPAPAAASRRAAAEGSSPPPPEPWGSGFPQDAPPSASRRHNQAAVLNRHPPGLTAGPLAEAEPPISFQGSHPSFQGSHPSSATHQDLPRLPMSPMEAQMAAAWLNQRYNNLGQALQYSEANINHLMNPDSNALSQVLERLQAAQQLQGAAAAQGGLPAAAALLPLMQLQQLAQSIGSSLGLDALHLAAGGQLPQQVPAHSEASGRSSAFPHFEGARQAPLQPPSLAASTVDPGALRGWGEAHLAGNPSSHRGSFDGSSVTAMQQALAMRSVLDTGRGSGTAQPGFFAEPKGGPLHGTPAAPPARGSSHGYLPTQLSVSTHSPTETRADRGAYAGALDSNVTGPSTMDVHNPFEVQRERLAQAVEDYRPFEGPVKPLPQRAVRVEPRGSHAAGPSRQKAATQGKGGSGDGADGPPGAKSSSPTSEAQPSRGRLQGDEELAAETLLNLFGPRPTPQDRKEGSPSQLRRPIKKRFR